jgi:hypothetical protein
MSASDPIEKVVVAGAVAALRRRAERQRAIAKDWTVTGADGTASLAGEAAIALRIAAALDQAADELEAEATR